MIVVLTDTGVDVWETDNLRGLHVAVVGLDEDSASALLRADGLGEFVDRDTVLLAVTELRNRAKAGATAADWAQRWTAMIDFAGTRGWLADEGRSVQAHVEWPVR